MMQTTRTDGFLPQAGERSKRQEKPRLPNKRLAESTGRSIPPRRLNTYAFCRPRLRSFDPSVSCGYGRSRRFGPSGSAETTMYARTTFDRRKADRRATTRRTLGVVAE